MTEGNIKYEYFNLDSKYEVYNLDNMFIKNENYYQNEDKLKKHVKLFEILENLKIFFNRITHLYIKILSENKIFLFINCAGIFLYLLILYSIFIRH